MRASRPPTRNCDSTKSAPSSASWRWSVVLTGKGLPYFATMRLASAATMSSRSEEHTSELQSHLNLVCRLLLEKKKTTDKQNNSALLRYIRMYAADTTRLLNVCC